MKKIITVLLALGCFTVSAQLESISRKSIEWYGGKGDGSDNSAAFKAALATKLPIYVPKGTYVVTNLSLSSDIIGEGQGSIISFKAGSTGFCIASGTNTVKISNLTVSGGGIWSGAFGTRHGVQLYAVGSPVMENVTVTGFDGYGIFVSGDTDLFARINHHRISDCLVNSNYYGIYLDVGNKSEYGLVDNNIIRQNYIGIFCGSANNQITGNNIYDNWYGYYLKPDNGRSHTAFIGNTVNHAMYPVWAQDCITGARIAGNHFLGDNTLVITNSTNIQLTDNYIEALAISTVGGVGVNYIARNTFTTTHVTAVTKTDNSIFEGNRYTDGTMVGSYSLYDGSAHNPFWDLFPSRAFLTSPPGQYQSALGIEIPSTANDLTYGMMIWDMRTGWHKSSFTLLDSSANYDFVQRYNPTNTTFELESNAKPVSLTVDGKGIRLDANGWVYFDTFYGTNFQALGSGSFHNVIAHDYGNLPSYISVQPKSGQDGFISFVEQNVAVRGLLGFAAGSADLVVRLGASGMLSGQERLRIADGTGAVLPGSDGTQSLGLPTNRWYNGYYSGTVDASGFSVTNTPGITTDLIIQDLGSTNWTIQIRSGIITGISHTP